MKRIKGGELEKKEQALDARNILNNAFAEIKSKHNLIPRFNDGEFASNLVIEMVEFVKDNES